MQSLSLAQTERNQLVEKLNSSQREMANASMEMDRIKREAFTRAETDKVMHIIINNMVFDGGSFSTDLTLFKGNKKYSLYRLMVFLNRAVKLDLTV